MRRIVDVWRAWRARCDDRRIAAQFSESDLRDLGLTQGDVYRELAAPLALPAHNRLGAGVQAAGQVAIGDAVVQ